MTTPPSLAQDLAFTSFPFNSQLAEDCEEPKETQTSGFRGFFNKFFSDGAQTSTSEVPKPETTEPDTQSPTNEEEPSLSVHVEPQSVSQSSPQRKISTRITQLIRPNSERQQLVDYNRSIFRQYWMPDSSGKECYECHERFTTFRRRHHCRFCGQIFCGKCCNRQISGVELGKSSPH